MALKDKLKWDQKYQNTPTLLQQREPSKKLIQVADTSKGKKALEVASGAGRNSIYLAKQGFEVEALDISQIALDTLESQGYENIITKLIDLDNYTPFANSYHLIVMTNFLDRTLIPKLAQALTKNGILLIETYMEDKGNTKPSSNPDFLLKQGELKLFFDDNFEIIDYDEFQNESFELYKMMKQSIVVRKL
ncbi:MAG: methyltransferase domain-containing protein [Arcobacteraceae bacterium]|nr:methyltransferase domain-containing protein [Arcobacteraceae bacterium]